MRLRKRPGRALSIIAAGLMLTLGLMLGVERTLAQDTATATAMAPHPAHIHSGSCTELGDVVYPLTDVSAAPEPAGTVVAMQDHEMGTPAMTVPTTSAASMSSPVAGSGTPESGPFGIIVETSETDVIAALADLAAGGYAINVHESAENIGNYIACGDITGQVSDAGDLTIKLEPLNDSGYMGTATLHDNGDGTTNVTITLTHSDEGM